MAAAFTEAAPLIVRALDDFESMKTSPVTLMLCAPRQGERTAGRRVENVEPRGHGDRQGAPVLAKASGAAVNPQPAPAAHP